MTYAYPCITRASVNHQVECLLLRSRTNRDGDNIMDDLIRGRSVTRCKYAERFGSSAVGMSKISRYGTGFNAGRERNRDGLRLHRSRADGESGEEREQNHTEGSHDLLCGSLRDEGRRGNCASLYTAKETCVTMISASLTSM
jgi:hypothetical protein